MKRAGRRGYQRSRQPQRTVQAFGQPERLSREVETFLDDSC
ncbi:TPA: hypothetical protein ACYEOW_002506 [Raoultella terrigena]